MCKKISALFLSVVISIQAIICGVSVNAFADLQDSTLINSEEDFREFVNNCVIDSYSMGKTFVLENDINILGMKIPAVPIFEGTFDGNGHKISGVSITEDGSATGLFRYIGERGTVKNLIVEGLISPTGTSAKCGGIAGVNKGRIVECAFSGMVSGEEDCGGIVGINETSGVIEKCESSGKVNASHRSGGICGSNRGIVRSCENKSLVNPVISDSSIDVEDLDMEELSESSDSLTNISDAGGIAGYSHGTIQGCINKGNIGYPHVGYNIGGIVGRQDGYVSGCSNYGDILGRKDCGGIVGQAEPYFMITYDNTKTDELETALDDLNALTEQLINDADSGSDSVSGGFSGINSALDGIRDSSDALLDEAERIINTDVDSVNELESRLFDLIDRLSEICDVAAASGGALEESLSWIKDSFAFLGNCVDYLDGGMKQIFSSSDKLADAFQQLSDGSKALGDALDSLKKGMGDPKQMKAALDALTDDIEAIKFAADSIADNANDLIKAVKKFENDSVVKDAVSDMEDSLSAMSEHAEKLSETLGTVSGKLEEMVSGLPSEPTYQDILDAIKELTEDKDFVNAVTESLKYVAKLSEDLADFSNAMSELINSEALKAFKTDLEKVLNSIESDTAHISDITDSTVTEPDIDIDALYKVIDYLKEAVAKTGNATDDGKAVVEIIEKSWDYLDNASENAIAAIYGLEQAAENAESAAGSITAAVDRAGDMFDYFSGLPNVNFVGADDGFTDSRDAMFDELERFTNSLDVLNSSANYTSGTLADDLRAINNKISDIEKIMSEIVDEIVDSTSKDAEDYVEDISVSELNVKGEGMIYSCKNYGEISADVNVGGISGAMGVESALSPESDDAASVGERSLQFTYMLRTIVNKCDNYGSVTAKKDGAGGIAGEMSTGCVNECGGFGNVSSTSGGYVGGAVGTSAGTVLKTAAMCELSGERNVGGIAGSGETVKDCRSFVKFGDTGEFTGSIAGDISGEYTGNAYVENGYGAVDGISYSEKAYPVTYEAMLKLSYVPSEFRKMKLIFVADGETVGEIDCSYGGNVLEGEIPEVPEKKGYNGVWEEFEKRNITFGGVINAVYNKPISVAASETCREDGLPVLLVEGAFADNEIPIADYSGDCWHITIPDDGGAEHRVRYYCGENNKNTDVLVNGIKVESEVDGRYLVFKVNMNSFTLTTAPKTINPMIFVVAGAVAVLVLIIVIVAVRKKRKSKVNQDNR